jgi:hypothetical protein
MQQGTITDEDRAFVETWENISPAANDIIRLDVRGDEQHELIQGKRKFMLTTADRLITQNKILLPEHDPFQNGSFRPVVVPPTVTVETNPNALSDEEIKQVLVSSDIAWAEWMKILDSPATLQRFLDIAESSAEDLKVSLGRYKQVAQRLSEVKPTKRVTSADYEKAEAQANSVKK